MKRMNKDGVLLCELQATAFEKSIDKMESSSEIFIRRFMRSRIAKRLDDGSVLESNIQAEDILQLVNEEYGFSNYGSFLLKCGSTAPSRGPGRCPHIFHLTE